MCDTLLEHDCRPTPHQQSVGCPGGAAWLFGQPLWRPALAHYACTLQNQHRFDSPPPLIRLPAQLFIGSTLTRGASNRFDKVTHTGEVVPQLGQGSSERDV
jgi:hypothetical protein